MELRIVVLAVAACLALPSGAGAAVVRLGVVTGVAPCARCDPGRTSEIRVTDPDGAAEDITGVIEADGTAELFGPVRAGDGSCEQVASDRVRCAQPYARASRSLRAELGAGDDRLVIGEADAGSFALSADGGSGDDLLQLRGTVVGGEGDDRLAGSGQPAVRATTSCGRRRESRRDWRAVRATMS